MAKQKFETLSAIHLAAGVVPKGSLVDLEVDKEGQVVSPIYRNRVRKLNAPVSEGETGGDAKGKAKAILDKAKQDADALLEKATADAKAIIDKAEEDAEAIRKAAGTPPPPAPK